MDLETKKTQQTELPVDQFFVFFEAFRTKKQDLEARIQSLEEQNQCLGKELQDKEAQLQSLEEQNQCLGKELQDKEAQLQSLEEKNQCLGKELLDKEAQLQSLEEKNQLLGQELESKKAQLQRFEEQNKCLGQELESKEVQHQLFEAETQIRLQDSEERIKNLEIQLQERGVRVQQLEEEQKEIRQYLTTFPAGFVSNTKGSPVAISSDVPEPVVRPLSPPASMPDDESESESSEDITDCLDGIPKKNFEKDDDDSLDLHELDFMIHILTDENPDGNSMNIFDTPQVADDSSKTKSTSPSHVGRKSRAIEQIDPTTGEVIARFESTYDAMRAVGAKTSTAISLCVNGHRKLAHRFKWKKSADDLSPLPLSSKRGRPDSYKDTSKKNKKKK